MPPKRSRQGADVIKCRKCKDTGTRKVRRGAPPWGWLYVYCDCLEGQHLREKQVVLKKIQEFTRSQENKK